jgi:uncharacterized protein
VNIALVGFVAVVCVAFAVGAVLGFGSTILSVTFGAQWVPLEVLLPVLAPFNWLIGLFIVLRYRGSVKWRLLLFRVWPAALVGLPLGMLVFNQERSRWLKVAFGLFVVILAVAQLRRERQVAKQRVAMPSLAPLQRTLFLVAGGFVHGIFQTGGPLMVYVLGREISEKNEFRSTVSMLFLPLGLALMVNYAQRGLYTPKALGYMVWAGAAMVVALVVGEWLHRRIDNERFRAAVWWALAFGGSVLFLRSSLAPG